MAEVVEEAEALLNQIRREEEEEEVRPAHGSTTRAGIFGNTCVTFWQAWRADLLYYSRGIMGLGMSDVGHVWIGSPITCVYIQEL